ATAKGIPLETWVYHQDRDAGIAAFEGPVRQAVEFYSDHIGPYPYEKLANVEAAGLRGATEHASAIFYSEQFLTGRPAAGVVAHELAHQGSGDWATEKVWHAVGLSEGLATFSSLLCTDP